MKRKFQFGLQYYMYLTDSMSKKNITTNDLLEITLEGINVSKEEGDEIAESNLLSLYVQIIASDYVKNKEMHNEGIERLFQLNEEIIMLETFPKIVLPHISSLLKKLINDNSLLALEFIDFCTYLATNYDNAMIPGKEYNDFILYFKKESQYLKSMRELCLDALGASYESGHKFFDVEEWHEKAHKLI